MVDVHYYGDITLSDMSHTINPNQKFVREIQIDDISKTEEHLLITTGNLIKRMVNGNSYMIIVFSFYQKKIIQSIESAKW